MKVPGTVSSLCASLLCACSDEVGNDIDLHPPINLQVAESAHLPQALGYMYLYKRDDVP